MSDMADAIESAAKALWDVDRAISDREYEDCRDGTKRHLRREVGAVIAALSAAGFGPVQEARAALERVNILANRWEDRGQHDMDYSKTIPDEYIAMEILTNGAGMVENARHIRNAIKGTRNDDQ